jgi:hypothetical protein
MRAPEEGTPVVMLYVAGKPVGPLADIEKLLPQLIADNQRVEFRDEAGVPLGTFTPERVIDPTEPPVPWDPSITWEELDRRAAEPGYTIDELRERLGWK